MNIKGLFTKTQDTDDKDLKFNSMFTSLSKQSDNHYRTLITLGLLINSGGIIGIITLQKGSFSTSLKIALMSYIASIIFIFVIEFIGYIVTQKSIFIILDKHKGRLKGDVTSLSDLPCHEFWYFITETALGILAILGGAIGVVCSYIFLFTM